MDTRRPIKVSLRIFHRKISPFILPWLLFVAITGLIYRIGRAWFAMSKETGAKVMHLHAGEWLGTNGSVVHGLVIGSALLFLICSGLWMWFTSRSSKVVVRRSHRVFAVVFSLPLIVTAVTGMAYQAGGTWFQASDGTLKLLLSLHQGSWLGPTLRPFYILFLACGVIVLGLTGWRMLPRRKPSSSKDR